MKGSSPHPATHLFLFTSLALVVGVRFIHIIDFDHTWLLIAAERMLSGDELYVDIMETNPPLIIYINAIPALLSEFISLSSYQIYLLFCAILIIVSLHAASRYATHKTVWHIIGTIVLVLLIRNDFAQREHLFLIVSWPLIIALLHQKSPHTLPIIAAGIGTALKPHFSVLWLCFALAEAAQQRSLKALFQTRYLLIATIQLAYLAFIWFAHPEYIHDILPLLIKHYSVYNEEVIYLLQRVAVLVSFSALCWWVVWRYISEINISYPILFAGVIGSAFIMLLQQKNFSYHWYPLYSFTFMITTTTAHAFYQNNHRLRPWIMGLCALYTLLMLGPSLLWQYRIADGRWDQHITNFTQTLKRYDDGGPVLSLSFLIKNSVPIYSSGAHFPYRYMQLWPIPGHYVNGTIDAQGFMTPHTLDDMTSSERHVFDHIIEDIKQHPPSIILTADDRYSLYPERREFRFDYIRYFSQSEQFATLMHDYEQVAKLHYATEQDTSRYQIVYARKDRKNK